MDNKKGCIGVPAAALALQGENDEAVTPEVGDEVELTVSGKVEATEDGRVYVRPTTANGEPVIAEAMDDDPKKKTPEDEDAELYAQAAAADEDAMI